MWLYITDGSRQMDITSGEAVSLVRLHAISAIDTAAYRLETTWSRVELILEHSMD